MFGTEDTTTEYDMLALESPKSHVLGGRKVAQLDKDRYVSVTDRGIQDRRPRNYSNPKVDDYSKLRDGAVNRSVDTGSYIKKTSKRTSKLDISSQDISKQDVFRSSKSKYTDYPKPKGRLGSLGHGEEGNGENLGLKKKSRLNGHKKDVLRDGMDTLDKSKSNRPSQKYDRENSYQKDLLGGELIAERRGFSKHSRDSSSYSDFSVMTHVEDEKALKRLTSANRPKSAGQAMLMTDFSSDSDDSFYDGEIEVVDLDDPVFAYEREFEESRRSGNAPKTNRPGGMTDTTADSTQTRSPGLGNHGDSENMNKQTGLLIENGLGSNQQRPHSDRNYDGDVQARPTTSHGRRRAQSEPEVERKSMIPRKTESRKSKQTFDSNKRLSQPFVSESLYSSSVDKVISKYSGLTVKKGSSNFPSQTNSNIKRSDIYPTRAPLPRKLKPILRREKMGHVNSTTHGEIDYQVSQ